MRLRTFCRELVRWLGAPTLASPLLWVVCAADPELRLIEETLGPPTAVGRAFGPIRAQAVIGEGTLHHVIFWKGLGSSGTQTRWKHRDRVTRYDLRMSDGSSVEVAVGSSSLTARGESFSLEQGRVFCVGLDRQGEFLVRQVDLPLRDLMDRRGATTRGDMDGELRRLIREHAVGWALLDLR